MSEKERFKEKVDRKLADAIAVAASARAETMARNVMVGFTGYKNFAACIGALSVALVDEVWSEIKKAVGARREAADLRKLCKALEAERQVGLMIELVATRKSLALKSSYSGGLATGDVEWFKVFGVDVAAERKRIEDELKDAAAVKAGKKLIKQINGKKIIAPSK